MGLKKAKKVFTFQTLPAQVPMEEGKSKVVQVMGFSLHAGVASEAHQRKKLGRLCRYISHSAVSEEQIQMTEAAKRRGMTWVQRLKRVFNIDIQIYRESGGFVKVIACIEEPELIKKLLAHVNQKPQAGQANQLPS